MRHAKRASPALSVECELSCAGVALFSKACDVRRNIVKNDFTNVNSKFSSFPKTPSRDEVDWTNGLCPHHNRKEARSSHLQLVENGRRHVLCFGRDPGWARMSRCDSLSKSMTISSPVQFGHCPSPRADAGCSNLICVFRTEVQI